MKITLGEFIVWAITGALAGSVAGALATRTKEGFGWLKNLGLGMCGAVVGGLLINLLKIDLGLGSLTFELEDLIAALVCSLVLLVTVWLVRRRRATKQAAG